MNGALRELCESTLFSDEMHTWYDRAEMRRLLTEHAGMKRDNGLRLFGLLTVGLFLQRTKELRTNRHTGYEGAAL
jgi:hypothetical protein